jgi:hypothetical protein
MKPQRKKPQKRAFTGRLVGRPYDGPAPSPKVIAGSLVQYLSNDAAPPKKKMGRPPKGAVSMTPAERKQRQRNHQRNKAEVDALIRQHLVDRATGGRGAGMFMKDAPAGKGLISTGGFDSAKLDFIIAKQDGLGTREQLRSKSSGAGSESNMHERSVYFDVRKYSAVFNQSWDLQQNEEEWRRILEVLMVAKTICVVCGEVIGASSGLATAEESDEHLRTHPLQEDEATRNELRCAVCDAAGTNHIHECELSKEDRKYNGNCKSEIFQQAGKQPRKMSKDDKAHRSVVRKLRSVLRATCRAIDKAVKAGAPALKKNAKYLEFLKPTVTIPALT